MNSITHTFIYLEKVVQYLNFVFAFNRMWVQRFPSEKVWPLLEQPTGLGIFVQLQNKSTHICPR